MIVALLIALVLLFAASANIVSALDRDVTVSHYLHVAWTQAEGSALPFSQSLRSSISAS